MEIQEKLLTISRYARPGIKLKAVKGIVVHWVGNSMTSAEFNYRYFEGLKNQTAAQGDSARFASAHYIIGLLGEIIRCVPEDEMAYHVGAHQYTDIAQKRLGAYPNNCTIGIELCHKNWDGEFYPDTLKACRELVKDLLERYKLTSDDVYRHYDITGKECPKYFVDNPLEWEMFRKK